VELIVVVGIVGLVFTVAGLAFSTLRPPRDAEWTRELRRAREAAIRSGMPVRARSPLPTSTALYRPLPPLFLPDGRAIGLGADPLTGAPID
jgi:hypothetical protein